ncbi:MAG: hypothetical protein CL922_05090, partial [Deltaproteobacteria bacterium]|nr:hypothetical protein [Deltaproteobacteria bacterium]
MPTATGPPAAWWPTSSSPDNPLGGSAWTPSRAKPPPAEPSCPRSSSRAGDFASAWRRPRLQTCLLRPRARYMTTSQLPATL